MANTAIHGTAIPLRAIVASKLDRWAISMSQPKLIGDFALFRQHCTVLRQNYNTYTELFQEENRDLLDRVAPTFFSDLAEIMHRDWILQTCKLMDPANTKRKGDVLDNVSINLINEQLEQCGLLNQAIKDLSQEILEYGNKIKPARDKRLAHYDRDHQINNITLGATTEQELANFLESIQRYCDEVGIAVGVGPLDFSGSGCKGDVLDFIKYLKNSTAG